MKGDDLGKLILRLSVGGLMLFHGVHKLLHGVEGIAQRVSEHHLPGFVTYGVYVGELIAPLLLIAGLGTRVAAVAVAINMLVAVWFSHANDLFRLNPRTGGYQLEVQAFYFFGALALVAMGSGRYALSRGRGRLD